MRHAHLWLPEAQCVTVSCLRVSCRCQWCGITCPPACPCLNCFLKCLACKVIGCDLVFCHFTVTAYPACCPACCCCKDEMIKLGENKLIVKGKEDSTPTNVEMKH